MRIFSSLAYFMASSSRLLKCALTLISVLTVTLSTFSVSYASNSNVQNKLLTTDQIEAAWRTFNIQTVENYVIPSYKKLATANNDLYLATQAFCKILAAPNTDQLQVSLANTKKAFHHSMNTWQLIQNIYFGPIEIGMRHNSIQFWPDKKNHTGKQLNKLILSKNEAAISVDGFYKNSVSVKGLPAIERLLFNTKTLENFKENPFSCGVMVAIARYLSNTSASLHEEWVTTMLPQFKDAKQINGYYEDDIDAATTLLKTLVEPIEIIRDLKLDSPLGSEHDKVAFKRLESWRSQRSLENIKLNIHSIESFFFGEPRYVV
jgi:predicted lipoprotein